MVDIDSTLYPFEQLVCDLALKMYGVELQAETPYWGFWETQLPGGQEDLLHVLQAAHEPERIISNAPYEGAVQALHRLAGMGMDFRYVSDRTGEALAATGQWLEDCGFPDADQLSCTEDKRQWMHNHRHMIDTIIDDRLLTLTHARFQLNIPHVFSLRHGWNVNLSDMPGVHLADDWSELADLVVKYHLTSVATL